MQLQNLITDNACIVIENVREALTVNSFDLVTRCLLVVQSYVARKLDIHMFAANVIKLSVRYHDQRQFFVVQSYSR